MATGCTFCEAPLTGSEMYCPKCGMPANSQRERLSALREALLVKVHNVPSVVERPAESNHSKAFAAGQRFSHVNLSRTVKYGGGFLIAIVVLGIVGNYWIRATRPSKNDTQKVLTKPAKNTVQYEAKDLIGGWTCHDGAVKFKVEMELFSDSTFIEHFSPNTETEIMRFGNFRLKGDHLFREETATNMLRSSSPYLSPGWSKAVESETVARSNHVTEEHLIVEKSANHLLLKPVRVISWDGISTKDISNQPPSTCTRDQTVQFARAKDGVPEYLKNNVNRSLDQKPTNSQPAASAVPPVAGVGTTQYLKPNVAYGCNDPKQETWITRIFLDDGRFSEVWGLFRNKTQPSSNVVGRWSVFSQVGTMEDLTLTEVLELTGHERSVNTESINRSVEMIAPSKSEPTRIYLYKNGTKKGGDDWFMVCEEEPESTNYMREITTKLWTSTSGARKEANEYKQMTPQEKDEEELRRLMLRAGRTDFDEYKKMTRSSRAARDLAYLENDIKKTAARGSQECLAFSRSMRRQYDQAFKQYQQAVVMADRSTSAADMMYVAASMIAMNASAARQCR